MITVGLVQADIKPHNVDANLKHYEELLLDKIQEPVNLLVFPEMYHCGFSEDLVQHAEPMNGRSVAFLHQTAQYFRCDVVATLPIRIGDNIVNRLVWMSPERILGWYDKKHLFWGIEQKICTAGEQRTVIESLGSAGYRKYAMMCVFRNGAVTLLLTISLTMTAWSIPATFPHHGSRRC